jgi:hypothetical protein
MPSSRSGVTTIKIRPKTKEVLRGLGEKGMSYDEIIQEVVSGYLAHIEEIYERLNGQVAGRPLKEIVDELEGRASSGGWARSERDSPKGSTGFSQDR